MRLHPGMEVYRKKVRDLVGGLGDPTRNLEVTEAIRGMVDRIVLTAEFRPGKKRATLVVDLEGALATILHLATTTKGTAPSTYAEGGVRRAE